MLSRRVLRNTEINVANGLSRTLREIKKLGNYLLSVPIRYYHRLRIFSLKLF